MGSPSRTPGTARQAYPDPDATITYRTAFGEPSDLTGHDACEVCEVVAAYVLIQTEVGKAGQVAGAASAFNGVQNAYPLSGP